MKTQVSPPSRPTIPSQNGFKVEGAVIIDANVDRIYHYLLRFEEYPRFISHLKSVIVSGPGKFHCVAEDQEGRAIQWACEIIGNRNNEMIAWKSLPGSDIASVGSIWLKELDPLQTQMRVSLKYDWQKTGGPDGAALVHVTENELQEDLLRLKRELEVKRN